MAAAERVLSNVATERVLSANVATERIHSLNAIVERNLSTHVLQSMFPCAAERVPSSSAAMRVPSTAVHTLPPCIL
ncbi:hypothetical protein AMTR_s00100p00015820 [Amborella trichopoda]|uniref:Uncharacterized protein n=1 Tax=Amborella trichopoda TaxID=13333 RepID=W1NYM4_AMBTC|nr:hypothetical protein AMTR_s00100p00015820 [Amborella trichopoda]